MTSQPLAVSAGCCRREQASIMLRVNSKIIMMPALWQVDVRYQHDTYFSVGKQHDEEHRQAEGM